MKQVESLIQFAKSIFFLVLANTLIVTGRILAGDGPAQPVPIAMIYVGLALLIPGILYGVNGFEKSRKGTVYNVLFLIQKQANGMLKENRPFFSCYLFFSVFFPFFRVFKCFKRVLLIY